MAGLTLADRRRAVQSMMAHAGVDRLVCAGNGHHMIDLDNPVAHLTGYRSIGPAIFALDVDGRSRLLVSPDERDATPEHGVDETRLGDIARLARDLPKSSRGYGIVGLDELQRHVADALLLALGDDLTPLDEPFYAATAAKTADEIEAARKATRIAEDGYAYLLSVARPGMRECDLAIDVNLYMRARGANDSFLMLNCGPRQDAVMPSSERVIENGDLLLCELSPSVAGQFTQICRTVAIGPVRDETHAAYPLLVAAMREGIARVRPGARVADVCGAIDDHLSAAGYSQFSRPPFIRRRGHGLGSGSTAPGDVAVDNATILEPGMLFMVHPNQFLPETGYMMCGEPVLVTEVGHEVLTSSQSALAETGSARS